MRNSRQEIGTAEQVGTDWSMQSSTLPTVAVHEGPALASWDVHVASLGADETVFPSVQVLVTPHPPNRPADQSQSWVRCVGVREVSGVLRLMPDDGPASGSGFALPGEEEPPQPAAATGSETATRPQSNPWRWT
jgi:hypothetical protein